jgi:hypothetical protein
MNRDRVYRLAQEKKHRKNRDDYQKALSRRKQRDQIRENEKFRESDWRDVA